MKKTIFFITMISCISLSAYSQIDREKKKKIQPANTNPVQTATSVYTLTGARVTLKTGNDNKEFPSQVTAYLIAKGSGYVFWQPGEKMRNEMRSNSTNEFGLDKWPHGGQGTYSLTELQKSGITLVIYYNPNFFADAWKIEGISVTLEFKDQNGNLHPSLGSKTIVFRNAIGFLNISERYFECRMDGNFTPITASILQNSSGIN